MKVTGEMEKRSRKRSPASESEDRAKQGIAGTAETGGQRQGHPQ